MNKDPADSILDEEKIKESINEAFTLKRNDIIGLPKPANQIINDITNGKPNYSTKIKDNFKKESEEINKKVKIITTLPKEFIEKLRATQISENPISFPKLYNKEEKENIIDYLIERKEFNLDKYKDLGFESKEEYKINSIIKYTLDILRYIIQESALNINLGTIETG